MVNGVWMRVRYSVLDLLGKVYLGQINEGWLLGTRVLV